MKITGRKVSISANGIWTPNALAAYLWRRLATPFLELASTIIFLVLTEYTQLVA